MSPLQTRMASTDSVYESVIALSVPLAASSRKPAFPSDFRKGEQASGLSQTNKRVSRGLMLPRPFKAQTGGGRNTTSQADSVSWPNRLHPAAIAHALTRDPEGRHGHTAFASSQAGKSGCC